MARERILILDDDENLLPPLSTFLSRNGFRVHAASSVPKAMKILDRLGDLDCALIDKGAWNDPGEIGHRGGLDVAAETKQLFPHATVVVFSGESHVNPEIERTGADYFVTKPISNWDVLIRALRGERVREGHGFYPLTPRRRGNTWS